MIRWEAVQELSDGVIEVVLEEMACPHYAIIHTTWSILHDCLAD
jgi:hypothetical protein